MPLIYQLDGPAVEIPLDEIHFTDRTRHVAGKACQRLRWYNYEAGPAGRGVDLVQSSEDLHLGQAVHLGLERMLLSGEVGDIPKEVAHSFKEAWERGEVLIQGDELLDVTAPEAAELLIDEQMHLIEALLWTFGRRHLAPLLTEYEVLACEQEIDWQAGVTSSGQAIVIASRPDAVLRRRSDGALIGVSYKTRKTITQDTIDEIAIDEQVATEMLAIQARYGEPCAGILYILFLKDEKRMDKDLGYRRYNSPLIRPYWQSTSTGEPQPTHFSWSYQWMDEQGADRRLGKGWRREDIWRLMPLTQWLEWLDTGLVPPLPGQFDWLETTVAMHSVAWNRRQLRDWLEGLRAIEDIWSESLAVLEELEAEPYPQAIFPRTSGNCYKWGSRCRYFANCWQDRPVQDDLISGRFRVRDANHPFEKLAWEQTRAELEERKED